MPADKDECLVCGSPPHGIHFGVFSCRACAAFFRRTLAIGKVYACRRKTRNCPVSKGIKNICRFCRFQKCKRVGMSFNDDSEDGSASSVASPPYVSDNQLPSQPPAHAPAPPQTPTSPLGLPEYTISHNKVLYDYEPFIAMVKQILDGDHLKAPGASTVFRQPALLNLLHAYRFIDPDLICPSPTLQQLEKVELKVILREMEQFLMRGAKFAMCSKEFASLHREDKWELYRRSGITIFHTVKPFWTVKHFGTDVFERRFAFGESWCVDVHSFEYNIEGFSRKGINDLNQTFKPHAEMMFKTVLTPMRELNLTEQELVFVLAHVLWNVDAVPGLSEQAVEVARRYLDEVTSDLHNYYVYEMRMDSYAVRLTKIVKLIANVEALRRYKKELMDMAEMFEIFQFTAFNSCF